jgi:nicotinate-nucleotide adenylyltransferase
VPQTLPQCVALLGGSFDPVHNGHIALGKLFAELLQPDQLRVIPTGSPWQKNGLQASAQQRVDMLRCAFDAQSIAITIDRQEIERQCATYTIDTLRALRDELGPQASIVFLIGADQLRQLDSWRSWRSLFDYAHVCAASRPGFTLEPSQMPAAVTDEFSRRAGTKEQIRSTTHGLTYIAPDLAVDISATQVRAALQRGDTANAFVPPVVLDYIEQHHLYKS